MAFAGNGDSGLALDRQGTPLNNTYDRDRPSQPVSPTAGAESPETIW
jgi:hypothetical protein